MKILVISDIHANLNALQTVLAKAPAHDQVWCLGDVVGYGPDPNECVEMIRELPNSVCLQGNHDRAALGMIDTTTFNPEAQKALHWTKSVLEADKKEFLRKNLNRTEAQGVTLAHGSPRQPVWEYILDEYTASVNFDYFETDYCFVGHTHLPVIFVMREGKYYARVESTPEGQELSLPKRSIVNPGSVGQPRDEDPRASYALYDSEQNLWVNHRVSYDIKGVQERMKKAGLPGIHIQRLEMGW